MVALWFLSSNVMAVAGPFGTYQTLSLTTRLSYWGGIVALAFVVGFATSHAIERCCASRSFWFRQLASALIFTLILLPILRAITLALPNSLQALVMGPWHMAAIVIMVPLGVGLLKFLWLHPPGVPGHSSSDQTGSAAIAAEPEPEPLVTEPRLLGRLRPDLRGNVLHLSVRDHYVDVLTDRGQDTVLMRFSDAMAELDGLDGLQVHRSHWVASTAISGTERKKGRMFLRLVDGRRVPVSRSYQSEVSARGLG